MEQRTIYRTPGPHRVNILKEAQDYEMIANNSANPKLSRFFARLEARQLRHSKFEIMLDYIVQSWREEREWWQQLKHADIEQDLDILDTMNESATDVSNSVYPSQEVDEYDFGHVVNYADYLQIDYLQEIWDLPEPKGIRTIIGGFITKASVYFGFNE
jgi:hypothetical protein